jgi:photosystem II protein PsbQ
MAVAFRHSGFLSSLEAHWITAVRRILVLALAMVLSLSLAACDGGTSRRPATIGPEDIAMIARQAEGFLAAKDRLPELATLVNKRNWIFTRNLIHGPMQEVGRQMLYINQRLLPADQAEANKRADRLKSALAELDEAARLQDGEKLRKEYIKVASGFGAYADLIPDAALPTATPTASTPKASSPAEPEEAAEAS